MISKFIVDNNINVDSYIVSGDLPQYNFKSHQGIDRFFIRPPLHQHYASLWPHLISGELSVKKFKYFGELIGNPIRRRQICLDPDADGNKLQFPSFQAIWPLLHNFCNSYNSMVNSRQRCETKAEQAYLISKSIEHVAQFLAIHPLTDGNGRVSRCIIQSGISQLTGFNHPLLPIGVLSYINAPLYYTSLEQICVHGKWRPFLSFMFCMLLGAAKLLLEILQVRQRIRTG